MQTRKRHAKEKERKKERGGKWKGRRGPIVGLAAYKGGAGEDKYIYICRKRGGEKKSRRRERR
jgi:hypothetical protein